MFLFPGRYQTEKKKCKRTYQNWCMVVFTISWNELIRFYSREFAACVLFKLINCKLSRVSNRIHFTSVLILGSVNYQQWGKSIVYFFSLLQLPHAVLEIDHLWYHKGQSFLSQPGVYSGWSDQFTARLPVCILQQVISIFVEDYKQRAKYILFWRSIEFVDNQSSSGLKLERLEI